ncbi:MAG: CCA tRNA nucleotidyltransferase [Bdellovibrionaceae bacterium]|nr:CCA tRNA nucleotidyltransferase [Pseudobdellovibrionaceae bacterium]
MRPELHQDWIDPKAAEIVDRLQKRKFEAYLVGGCVRDLLVNEHPKDYDIATSARPEEVRKIIPNSFLIGRRFKLILVRRGLAQYEVSTFRRSRSAEDDAIETEIINEDNFFGTAEEDAVRRDFTVNALFYDPINKKMLDYCNGLADIENRTIRIIGDPIIRLNEDPIRILRGIRLAHKLNFNLEGQLRSTIQTDGACLKNAILPRKREEFLKILRLKDPGLTFLEMFDLKILQYCLPSLNDLFLNQEAQTIFLSTLADLKKLVLKDSDPANLFLIFLYSYIKAAFGTDDIKSQDLEDNILLNRLMKDELGVFKQEAIHFFKTLSFMSSLTNIDTFNRKGERRKQGFLSNPYLDTANELCLYEHLYRYSDYWFWKKQIQSVNG